MVYFFQSEYAWILSRDYPMSESALLKAQQAFVQNGLDLNLFNPTTQGGDCIYYTPWKKYLLTIFILCEMHVFNNKKLFIIYFFNITKNKITTIDERRVLWKSRLIGV